MTDTVYGSLAGFHAYHTARGRDTTVYNDAQVNASSLIGSEWLDGRYRSSFPGLKVGQRAQIREWPRYGAQDTYGNAIDSATVPDEITNATYEATLRDLEDPGQLSIDLAVSKYKQVGVVGAVSATFAPVTSAIDGQTKFIIVDQILAPILTGVNANVSPLSGSAARA